MKHSLVKHGLMGLSVLVLLTIFAPAAKADCASCGITSANIADWRSLDFNGNGLSTFDLIVVRRVMLTTGDTSLTRSDVIGFVINQTDVNGDGVYDNADFQIIREIYFWMRDVGISVFDQSTFGCLSDVILGRCG